jgi:hypothetical protein
MEDGGGTLASTDLTVPTVSTSVLTRSSEVAAALGTAVARLRRRLEGDRDDSWEHAVDRKTGEDGPAVVVRLDLGDGEG